MAKAKMSAENQKMREKCEKNAKKLRKVTQHGPQTKKVLFLDGIRETLSLLRKELKPSVTYENPLK